MIELSTSNRKIGLEIKSFDIENESSKKEVNENSYLHKSENISVTITNNKNFDKNFENIKINSTFIHQNKKMNVNKLSPSEKDKSSKSSKKTSKLLSSFLGNKILLDENFIINKIFKDVESEEEERKEMNKICLVCENKLTEKEMSNNFLECFHGFCDSCYYDYLKEKINTNNIEKIKCLKDDCNVMLYDNFIQYHLRNDIPLLEKYLKFKKRRQLMLDPNIQLCPYPNCESYAKKYNNNYFVTCMEGHKFCFNCLKDWHGNEKCKLETDSKFDKWKNSKNVKRCPNCQYFVEKNMGCNHMICANCKYEWCWLCLKESLPGHYDEGGNCEGLQYSKYQCFSNRFCVFLYHILLNLLDVGKLFFMSPLIIFIFFYDFIKDINNDLNCFFHAFITFFYFINKIIYGIVIMFILSILMIFIWPLKRAVSSLFDDIFNDNFF